MHLLRRRARSPVCISCGKDLNKDADTRELKTGLSIESGRPSTETETDKTARGGGGGCQGLFPFCHHDSGKSRVTSMELEPFQHRSERHTSKKGSSI